MLHTVQLENPISTFARRKERENALAVLEKAKSIQRKVVFLPPGACQWSYKEKPKDVDKVSQVIEEQYPEDLINVDKAMEKTGYKRSTLHGYFTRGFVQGIKIKNKLYFQEPELMRFVAERKARNPVQQFRKRI